MDRDETKSFIERFYQARVDGDMGAIRSFLAEDCTWQLAGEGADPSIDKTAPSAKASADFIEALIATFAWHGYELHDLLIDGDKAAARYTLDVTHNPSGERVKTQIADHITFSGDRVTSFTEFVDTAMVQRMTLAAS